MVGSHPLDSSQCKREECVAAALQGRSYRLRTDEFAESQHSRGITHRAIDGIDVSSATKPHPTRPTLTFAIAHSFVVGDQPLTPERGEEIANTMAGAGCSPRFPPR